MPSVTVCRAAAQAVPLVTSLRAEGYEVVELPLLAIVPPPDGGAALTAAVEELGRFEWVAFTSTNAVAAFVDRLDRVQIDASSPVPRLAAVGAATARALDAAGYPADHVAAVATAADLAAGLPASPGDRVLAPLGVLATDDLADGLRHRDVECERVDAYATDVPSHPEDRVEAALATDAVLLTAPSVVDRLLELAAGRRIPPGLCIGPRTQRRAIERSVVVLGVADPHDDEGLIASLVRALPTHPTDPTDPPIS